MVASIVDWIGLMSESDYSCKLRVELQKRLHCGHCMEDIDSIELSHQIVVNSYLPPPSAVFPAHPRLCLSVCLRFWLMTDLRQFQIATNRKLQIF